MSAELVNIYNKLYNDAIEKIRSDQYQTDDLVASSSDKRFGLVLVMRPDEDVKHRIIQFVNDLHVIESHQYYYPCCDIHVTVLPIIDCYEGFDYNQIEIEKYVDVIAGNIPSSQNIEMSFKGVTASSSCIMIQGFPHGSILDDIRNSLRMAFKRTSLQQTIDKRYFLQTAHVTVVRFIKPFTAKEQFVKILENFKDYDFGKTRISEIELVYNDWCVRDNFSKTLFRFKV